MPPGRETVLAYSGGVIDRAANQRSDPEWVSAVLAADSARLIPMWRDRCIVSGEPAVPVVRTAAGADALLGAAAETVFLGLDDDGGVFAADLSPLPESRAVEVAGGAQVLDVRSLVGTLRPGLAALLGYARGILYWHRNQRYCGTCGSPTRPGHGGHPRTCQNEACARLHFPRVEPAEETGIPVGPVTYVASQGWPFPSGLMIGFRAGALAETVRVDGEEVIEARWFTRAELAGYGAAGDRLGREDSIDKHLLQSWLAEAG